MSRPKSRVPEPGDNCQPVEEEFPFGANEPATHQAAPDPLEPTARAAAPDPTTAGETAAKDNNPFSREALRLDNNYAAFLKTETHQHSIPVAKPPQEVWFRVHDGQDFFFDTFLLDLKAGPHRGIYQISKEILQTLKGEKTIKPMRLVLCIDRQGEMRIWPLRLPSPDRREDDWMSSALTVAELAKTKWVKLISGDTGYKHQDTPDDLPDPVWPERTFDDILDAAFAKRRISKMTDPVLLHLLRGV
jgi:hypothetical protein